MKQSNKQRLFEVMGKVDKSFKNSLNENTIGISAVGGVVENVDSNNEVTDDILNTAKAENSDVLKSFPELNNITANEINSYLSNSGISMEDLTAKTDGMSRAEIYNYLKGSVLSEGMGNTGKTIILALAIILSSCATNNYNYRKHSGTQRSGKHNNSCGYGKQPGGSGSYKQPPMEESNFGKTRANPKYTHFAVLKNNNMIVNGWEYRGYDQEELKSDKNHYFLNDIRDMQIDPKLVNVVTAKHLQSKGIDPYDFKNWNKDNSIFTL